MAPSTGYGAGCIHHHAPGAVEFDPGAIRKDPAEGGSPDTGGPEHGTAGDELRAARGFHVEASICDVHHLDAGSGAHAKVDEGALRFL